MFGRATIRLGIGPHSSFRCVCESNISGTAERICAKFTGKTCLVRRSDTDTDTDILLKTYATNVRKYDSTMTVTHNSSTIQH